MFIYRHAFGPGLSRFFSHFFFVDRVGRAVLRKRILFLRNLSLGKCLNALKALTAYLTKSQIQNALPLFVKIDTTPFCHLRCPVCIHTKDTSMPEQDLHPDMVMRDGLFRKIIDELAGKTLAISLNHLGDPLEDKKLCERIAYATQKKINTSIATHFSYKFSDHDLKKLIESGLSVCYINLDGFTQEVYGSIRVNGNIELVKYNLQRLMALRNEMKRKLPFVEVQTCIYDFNKHELPQITEFCKEIRVDSMILRPGLEDSFFNLSKPRSVPHKKRWFPLCKWPYFAATILYDGDVLPCCKIHFGNTYAKHETRIKAGSIAQSSFAEVYNNELYRQSRMLSCEPILDDSSPLAGNFCYRCMWIYD